MNEHIENIMVELKRAETKQGGRGAERRRGRGRGVRREVGLRNAGRQPRLQGRGGALHGRDGAARREGALRRGQDVRLGQTEVNFSTKRESTR